MHEYTTRKTSDLIPYVNNARTHSDKQVNQVAASIKEFGFTNPILIDESNGIIAGHGRLQAAQKLNLDEVPCIILEGLTEAQKKAYVIADNQLALNAGWDDDLLKLEIENLKELDFDIELLGFEDDFIDKIFSEHDSPIEAMEDAQDSKSIEINDVADDVFFGVVDAVSKAIEPYGLKVAYSEQV